MTTVSSTSHAARAPQPPHLVAPSARRGALRHRSRRARVAAVALASAGMMLPAVLPASAAVPTAAVPTTAVPTAAPSATSQLTGSTAACSTRWGTGAKGPRIVTLSRTTLTGVRAGAHPCFDRIVVDLSSQLSHRGFRVGYVRAVEQDGSGDVVSLRGQAKLRVVVGAPAHDANGRPTYVPRHPPELVRSSSLRAVKQVAWAGSFEGQTTIGVGVDRARSFRAFVLDSTTGPDRLVIDIATR